jgi:L-fuculose-phosphate aldolase
MEEYSFKEKRGEVRMSTIAEQIVYAGKKMFDRRLTDFSGGNISARQEDQIWITPRFAGSKQHWNLATSDILHGPIHDDTIHGNPRFSREGKAHLAIYRTFPEAQAVIHAHPFYVLPFCVAEKPIHPPLESAAKFETIKVIPYAPAHSDELAQNIIIGLQGQNHIIKRQAAGLILPRHGIIMAGRDLYATLDAVERINWNAWCILAQGLLASLPTPAEPS